MITDCGLVSFDEKRLKNNKARDFGNPKVSVR